jgi:hypothetical protein
VSVFRGQTSYPLLVVQFLAATALSVELAVALGLRLRAGHWLALAGLVVAPAACLYAFILLSRSAPALVDSAGWTAAVFALFTLGTLVLAMLNSRIPAGFTGTRD